MQTRKALKALSKGEVDYEGKIGPLAKHASRLIKSHDEKQANIKTEQERRSFIAAMPVLQAARGKMDKIIGDKVMPDDTPIVSRFDAFSVIKSASKKDKSDQGLRNMSLHLERLWHKEPLGIITAGALTRLRDHYQQTNSRSRIAEIVDMVIPTVSFNSLPIVNLIRIASQIGSQEDYDIAIARHGIGSDAPKHVRARTFIRALLNQKEAFNVVALEEGHHEEKRKEEEGQFEELFKVEDRPLPGQPGGAPQMGILTPSWKEPKASKIRGSDIAARVAARIQKTADDTTDFAYEAAEECDKESGDVRDKTKIEAEDLGVEGSGMMPVTAELIEAALTGGGFKIAQIEGQFDIPGISTADEVRQMAVDAVTYAQADPQIAKLIQQMGIDPNMPNAAEQVGQLVASDPNAMPILEKITQLIGKMIMQEEMQAVANKAAQKESQYDIPGIYREDEIRQMATDAVQYAQTNSQVAELIGQLGVEPDMPNAAEQIGEMVANNPEYMPVLDKITQLIGQIVMQEEMEPAKQVAAFREVLAQMDESESVIIKSGPESEEELLGYDIGQEFGGGTEIEELDEEELRGLAPDEAEGEGEFVDQEFEKFEQRLMAAAKETKKVPMDPSVNTQQPDQVSVPDGILKKETKLTQKRPSMKAAVLSNNPMVDDDMDHLPIHTPRLAATSVQWVNSLTNSPDWWLGSLDELKSNIKTALNQKIAEIPEAFKKNIEKMKGKSDDKDDDGDKGDKKDKKKDSFENLKKKKGEIENIILSGQNFKFAGYEIYAGTNSISVSSKKGSKEYQLLDMDYAIDDFIYLAGTTNVPESEGFPSLFYIKEGIRLACPGCHSINSYPMPKEASDLGCDNCDIIIPEKVVKDAFNVNAAQEESILTAYVPENKQTELGDIFAKAASKINADIVDTIGNCAEAHAVNASNESKAEAWDILIEAGFKPIAQEIGVDEISLPEDADPPLLEMGIETPSSGSDIKDYTTIFEGWKAEEPDKKWELAVIEYGTKAKDEIASGEVSLDEVISTAKRIFDDGDLAGGLPAVMASLEKIAGDIPSTKVNTQQPDAEKVPKNVLGPDSDTKGDIKTPGKPKSQVKPQSTFSNTKVDKESDSRDPGDFGAGKPKAQHPDTDQQGVSKAPTELGKDSDHQDNKTTRNMDSKSKAAPKSMQSK
jgi:hypothetical protein